MEVLHSCGHKVNSGVPSERKIETPPPQYADREGEPGVMEGFIMLVRRRRRRRRSLRYRVTKKVLLLDVIKLNSISTTRSLLK